MSDIQWVNDKRVKPSVEQDMVNNPPHYKGESGKPKKYQAFTGVLNERIKQVEQCIADAERKHAHYFKDVSNFDEMDTYLFCRVWKIQDDSGALHHALKKMMDAGKRGGKDKIKDITEARDTLNRYLEIEAMFSE